jgi:hypothetical protein
MRALLDQERTVMPSWFTRPTTVAAVDPATPLGAYKEGRKDERLRTEGGPPDPRRAKAELNDAVGRGRREERLRGRTSPLVMLVLVVLAAIGALTSVLAVRYGSFAAAGEAVDAVLYSIASPPATPVRN